MTLELWTIKLYSCINPPQYFHKHRGFADNWTDIDTVEESLTKYAKELGEKQTKVLV